MTRTTLLVPIMLVAGIPLAAGARSVPAIDSAPKRLAIVGSAVAHEAVMGPDHSGPTGDSRCAPLTWQSLYPWTHCHDWGHQVYGNGWGLPYFSIGFGGSGFAPVFPVGAYWGLDVRFLNLGWGHAHGPHFAGTPCAYRGDCLRSGVRPPAKSFTIERPATQTADDSDSSTAPAAPLLFVTGRTAIGGSEVPDLGRRRGIPTGERQSTEVDDDTPAVRWALPGGGDDPTRIGSAPVPVGSEAGVKSRRVATGDPEIVTLAPPTSRRLNSAQRSRPASSFVHRVFTARGSSALTSAQSRSRVRAIDRAVRQWQRGSSGRRTSVFGGRSARGQDISNRGGSAGSRSVRSRGSRGSSGSSGARPARGRKAGKSGSTKVRTGGGGE